MRIYEGMFVLDDARSGSNWDGVVTEVRGILERRGAEILTCERWDERRLAYRIQGRTRAVYLLIRFTVPTEAISPIKRDCELNETILRALILRDHGSEKLHKEGLFPPQEAPAPAAAAPAAEAPATEAPTTDAPATEAPAADAPAAEAPAADAPAADAPAADAAPEAETQEAPPEPSPADPS